MDRGFDLKSFIRLKLAFGISYTKIFDVYNKQISGQTLNAQEKTKIESISEALICKTIDDCKTNGIDIITFTDKRYPECLRNITAPPIVLFIKGNLPDFLDTPTVTIVGPRKVSDFGKRAAYSLALRLSKAGFNVVSGAALGADSEALKGAIAGGGVPIGVLACGLCNDYPLQNRELRNNIAKTGCLISECTPYEGATKFSFPIRNRIMSALSLATVVVEAGEKSGALITAKHALDQGKDVLVIPGNPTLQYYKGSNALLRDGAIPLLDASDVFSLYLPRYPEKIDLNKAFSKDNEKKTKKLKNKSVSGLSKNAAILYNTIDNNNFTADDMLRTGLSGDEILSSLTELELSGFIKSLPGGLFEVL